MSEIRLIDANALKEMMKKRIVSTNHNAITLNREQRANNDAILECIEIIDNAPTVPLPDFKEVYKKNRWIRCNQCGWDNGLVIPRYCWNCRAKLRKGGAV